MRCAASPLAVVAAVLLAAPAAAEAQEAIYVVRHAERTGGARPPSDAALTEQGRERARALASLLAPAGITAIYVSNTARSHQTAGPLAARLGVQPREMDALDVDALVARMRAEEPAGRVLVVAHSNTVPLILAALGHTAEVAIGDDDYDDLFLVVPAGATPVVLRHRYRSGGCGAGPASSLHP